MAADDSEAQEWLSSMTKGASSTRSMPNSFHEVLEERRGTHRYIGIHHLKFVRSL
jgi:hypothetical protein